jgi:hypothetical protein
MLGNCFENMMGPPARGPWCPERQVTEVTNEVLSEVSSEETSELMNETMMEAAML